MIDKNKTTYEEENVLKWVKLKFNVLRQKARHFKMEGGTAYNVCVIHAPNGRITYIEFTFFSDKWIRTKNLNFYLKQIDRLKQYKSIADNKYIYTNLNTCVDMFCDDEAEIHSIYPMRKNTTRKRPQSSNPITEISHEDFIAKYFQKNSYTDDPMAIEESKDLRNASDLNVISNSYNIGNAKPKLHNTLNDNIVLY